MLNLPSSLSRLENKKEYVLIFSATWCGPCGPAKKVVDEVCHDMGVAAYLADVDLRDDAVQQYGIYSVPTVLVFRDGEIVESFTGSVDPERLREVLK